MRWESQNVSSDDAGRLPGLGDTVVRRFDAPEALNMRFHEVRTKSALNHVPGGARGLPFEWTINPYRGCTHACVYCVAPDTPVLLANGRPRRIADLRIGDEIYGTARRGISRRYVKTEVLAHWSTVKDAYRVTLEDGTELVSSGDHRFLSRRGWKYVSGTQNGRGRRPHLTLDDTLLGIGAFPVGPVDDAGYRHGYLCGVIRGGGPVGSQTHPRPGRAVGDGHRFRLALADLEALRRAREYLSQLDVTRSELELAGSGSRPMQAIRAQPATTDSRGPATIDRWIQAQRPDSVERARHLVAWPERPTPSWRKGFLAGSFDANGTCGESLRIASTDGAIVAHVAESLHALGFRHVIEDRRLPNGLRCVRLLGGTSEQQRFFLTVDPAIARKRSIEGRAVKTSARLGVASIEPLGFAMPMYDITTGTRDFVANGVISHNCFARPTHEYLDMDAGRDFEREIVVKVNVPEVLRAELGRKSWRGASIALGTNTDPYQWVEGRYKLMRGIWEAMRDFRNPCSILTKSPLVLRDLDLLQEIAAVTDVSACLSVPTMDEKAWRATEPHTPSPKARLEAVGALNRAGIPTGVLIAPLMPGVNDAPEQVERIVEAATEAKATYIGGQTLFLRGAVRDIYFAWLREHRPDLVPLYERLYAKGAYVSAAEKRKIELAAGAPWALRTYPVRERHRGPQRPPVAVPRPPRVVQGSLF